jgi:hypothetical protein
MSGQPEAELPDTVPALEPDTLPNHPLRAKDCEALLSAEIG